MKRRATHLPILSALQWIETTSSASAGRRGAGVSLAVTFCRGRSHDDYYYERVEAMTGEVPPPPYVDVTREELINRVIAKEALRQAFTELAPETWDGAQKGQRTFARQLFLSAFPYPTANRTRRRSSLAGSG